MRELLLLPIDDVTVGPRLRPVGNVFALAESIHACGLLNPITITPDKRLIAGAHRLEACKQLGWEHIDAHVFDIEGLNAELAEIDENLIRAELTTLERGEHLARRKAIYEELHPQTRSVNERGGPGRGKTSEIISSVSSFADDAAAKTGVSARTIQQEVKIAQDIAPDVKEAIRNTPAADRKTDLLALASVPADEQRAAVEAVSSGAAPSIKEAVHNHRAQGSGENEWYTPQEYVEAARRVLGAIDLDPASSAVAQQRVQAGRIFTQEDDGLAHDWAGRVWLNPPYAQPAIRQFVEKMTGEVEAGRVSAAIMLTHNYTDTAWFHIAAGAASAICFTRGRIGFLDPDGKKAAPTQGQAFFYYGNDAAAFAQEFKAYGLIVEVTHTQATTEGARA